MLLLTHIKAYGVKCKEIEKSLEKYVWAMVHLQVYLPHFSDSSIMVAVYLPLAYCLYS